MNLYLEFYLSKVLFLMAVEQVGPVFSCTLTSMQCEKKPANSAKNSCNLFYCQG
jgi:hypothetical protein